MKVNFDVFRVDLISRIVTFKQFRVDLFGRVQRILTILCDKGKIKKTFILGNFRRAFFVRFSSWFD